MRNGPQTQKEGDAFESDVRRVARLLWPQADIGGPEMVDGRETDGIFETEEAIHIIEATVSRQTKKASADANKLRSLVRKHRSANPTKAVKGYFVTRDDPTAEQRASVRKVDPDIACIGFDQLRNRIVDVRSYISLRRTYPYGSARNLRKNSSDPRELDTYIPLDILSDDGVAHSTKDIAKYLESGGKCLLLGDFGAGKSMTVRDVFEVIAKKCMQNSTHIFPLTLNLRDHQGQTRPSEAIRRHAEDIGYPHPDHLIRAWRDGMCLLILDGFDEMTTFGWTSKASKLKDVRHRSMELVRKLVSETPESGGVMIVGRSHFFDNMDECIGSMGLSGNLLSLNLNEFSDLQVKLYLEKYGWKNEVPEWLPTRPYLIGELIAKGLLSEKAKWVDSGTAGEGWDLLLDGIASRESKIEVGIQPNSVRSIIEDLASRARCTQSGRGPLTESDFKESFESVCGYKPDEHAFLLLQRLPGLGIYAAEDGSREFVDADLVDAARVGQVLQFTQNPFSQEIYDPSLWSCGLATTGKDLLVRKFMSLGFSDRKVSAALDHSVSSLNAFYLSVDLLSAMSEFGHDYIGSNITISEALIEDMIFDDGVGNLGNITISDCLIGRLELSLGVDESKLPFFKNCAFDTIEGRTRRSDVSGHWLDASCDVENFGDDSETSSKILSSSLPLGLKVALSILKKLYLQAGSGRKENAFSRGMGHKEKRIVSDALEILRKEGLAIKSSRGTSDIWLPVRGCRPRVYKLVKETASSGDPVIQACENL